MGDYRENSNICPKAAHYYNRLVIHTYQDNPCMTNMGGITRKALPQVDGYAEQALNILHLERNVPAHSSLICHQTTLETIMPYRRSL